MVVPFFLASIWLGYCQKNIFVISGITTCYFCIGMTVPRYIGNTWPAKFDIIEVLPNMFLLSLLISIVLAGAGRLGKLILVKINSSSTKL